MEYTTQMDAARKGIITKEMEIAAKKENMDVKELMEYMAKGQVIIPCNKLHTSIEPNAIGSMLKTKINVNLGISRDWKDMDMEIEKVNNAVKMGAESIMDLRKGSAVQPLPTGTTSTWQIVARYFSGSAPASSA